MVIYTLLRVYFIFLVLGVIRVHIRFVRLCERECAPWYYRWIQLAGSLAAVADNVIAYDWFWPRIIANVIANSRDTNRHGGRLLSVARLYSFMAGTLQVSEALRLYSLSKASLRRYCWIAQSCTAAAVAVPPERSRSETATTVGPRSPRL